MLNEVKSHVSGYKLFSFLLFVIAVAVSCNRCKEECDDPTNPDCPNYVEPVDPCAGSSEVSADFTIEAKTGPTPAEAYYVITEAALGTATSSAASQHIRVRAKQDGLNYKWVIGADTIYEQEYSFVFGNEFFGGTYPIELIVSGIPDSTCFPEDDGRDTLIRYLPVVEFIDNPIFGTYMVAFESNPLDSFEVKLSCHIFQFDYYDVYAHNFSNLATIQDSCIMDVDGYTYNYLVLKTLLTPCQRLTGTFWINPDDSFEAQYEIDIDPTLAVINMQPFHAKGRRIN